jgi:hypothetical protein
MFTLMIQRRHSSMATRASRLLLLLLAFALTITFNFT